MVEEVTQNQPSAARGSCRERAAWRPALLVGAVLVVVVGLWMLLGGLQQPGALDRETALQKAAELGERLQAGLENQREVTGLEPELLALLASRPDLAEAWTLLGQVRLVALDHTAAMEALSEALRLRELAEPGSADAQLHLLAGSAAERAGLLFKAQAHFRLATERAPADASAALRLAHTALRLDQLDSAAVFAGRATELDAGLAAAWGLRSELDLRRGNSDAALASAERAAALTAEAGGAEARAYALLLARQLSDRGEPLLAARVLRLPDPADFFTPAVMAAHAEALAAAGLPEGAANYHERWMAHDPGNALAAAEATRWYLTARNLDKARATLVVLERINPRDDRLADLKAELLRLQAHRADPSEQGNGKGVD